ncbi:MAG: prepilin peptidase [Armatimonadetes bacterium]|nr:prepilin peptidase [Armatimonadota bacterium]
MGFYIGAAIGSFLNVVIYRMPRGISLGNPKHSFCPNCNHQLGIPDLFPLLSWLVQFGKCRYCRVKVPSRYFWVEMVTGSLWGIFWWQNLVAGTDPFRFVALALFASALVAAIYIDLKFFIIPDQVNAAMLVTGLAYNAVLFAQHSPRSMMWGMPVAVAGALVGTVSLWAVAFLGRLAFGKDAMGHGDIKMTRGIGAVLFPAAALASIGVAVILGAFLGIIQILARRKTQDEAKDAGPEDEGEYVPESLGSLLKCGLGYLLLIDVFGLFVPRLYEWWFGENPFAVEAVEDEDVEVGATTIPFGPYLALGAIVLAIFEKPILTAVERYINGEM